MPPTGTRFHLSGVGLSFGGKPVLEGIDLDIEPGEALAFVGPSGSGKTSLLRLLSSALRPTAGNIEIDGAALGAQSGRRLRGFRASCGFVHQNLDLVDNLRVIQNVLAGRFGRQGLLSALRSTLFPPRDQVREAHALLERVGIAEKLYQRCDQLSGGQRQRVAIARALYQGGRCLLVDEPVSSLDPARSRDTIQLLSELSQERGLTLIASMHDLDLAKTYFPRLVGLRRGRIAFDAPADQLDAAQLRALYTLEAQELLADGS